ncbi:MAG: GNAT family N-acetyltransferase [bacterium]|nr:GNAT family N-acetyltransferase [bacterium]
MSILVYVFFGNSYMERGVAVSDVLMFAETALAVTLPDSSYFTNFMPTDEFREREDWYRPYHNALWDLFHTRGKHAAIEKQAQWIVVALDEDGKYLGSALIVETRPIWYVHYVMAVLEFQRNGVGTAVMVRVMQEAHARDIPWVLLNCDPKKGLPAFYAKFGFRVIARLAIIGGGNGNN